MILRILFYCLAPLGVLLISITLAAIIGYAVLLVIGDLLPMDKIVSKGTQIFLILSIFPLRNRLQLSWETIGFTGKRQTYLQFLQGLVIGIAILGPVILLLYCFDVRSFDSAKIWTSSLILETVLLAFLSAFAISLLEEPVFRGILLTGLERKLGLITGIIISACYYAMMHFLKTDIEIPYQELNILSGLELAFDAFSNVFKPENLSSFLALMMVGIFLGVARLMAGLGLGFCIGCHTAWVFLIKSTKKMSRLNTDSEYFYLTSYYDGVIGPLVTGWLLLAVATYICYTRYRQIRT